MTYWLYSAERYMNGQSISFCGVIQSDNKFFPLRKLMETHFLVVGQIQTTVSNAVEISEEDYNYFINFSHNANLQTMGYQMSDGSF